MKYIIKILKVETVTENDREWQKLYDAEAFEKAQEKDSDVEQYGYRPIEKEVEKETNLYTQVIEGEINLVDIIAAVNQTK